MINFFVFVAILVCFFCWLLIVIGASVRRERNKQKFVERVYRLLPEKDAYRLEFVVIELKDSEVRRFLKMADEHFCQEVRMLF